MVVKEIRGNRVHLVKIEDESSCHSCPLSKICNIEEPVLKVEKPNFDLREGDEVVVEIPEGISTKLSFFTYTLPLILFMTVIVLAKSSGSTDLTAFLLGLGSMGVYYLALKFLDTRIAFRYSPRIISKK